MSGSSRSGITRRRVLGGLAVAGLGVVVGACQAAATPVQPAAPAVAANLFLTMDTVQGSTNVPTEQAAARSCVLSSRYPRNSQIVWRGQVGDPKTGEYMDDKALSKVQVQLANDKTIDMKYAAHPKDPPGESFWTGSWMVPKDQPTGTIKYKVVATATDGRTGTYEPRAVPPSLVTITDEVLPDAPAKK
jgi:hypothetical protein